MRRWVLFLAGWTAAVAVAAPPAQEPETKDLVKKLIEALKDTDPDVRQNLGSALAKIGPDTVEPLLEALKGENPDRRAGAAYALGLLGPHARPALQGLLDALKDESVEVRRQASFAIARILPGPKPVRTAPDPTIVEKK